MVRLVRKVINGKPTWAEDAPERCFNGHTELVPTWSACPACGVMVRMWQCRAAACDEVLVDAEHVHGSGR